MPTEPVSDAVARTERALEALLPAPEQAPERLHQAMRYACLNGGKRLRAQLPPASYSTVIRNRCTPQRRPSK